MDGHKLGLFNREQIKELLIKFIKMSKKNDQQAAIDEIKRILKTMGFDKV